MKLSASDHALSIVKAGLNAVPLVGGSLASLVSDYIPTATQRNLERAVADLHTQLSALGSRVDAEAVNRDEFAELFKSAYLVVVRSHSQARTTAAMRLVANVLLKPDDHEKLSYTELDHFARCLDKLSRGALQVLAKSVAIAHRQAPGLLAHKSVPLVFLQLHAELPDLSPALLMGLVGELDAFNLLHRAGVPGIRTAEYSNYSVEVTPLGGRFVEHLFPAA